MGRVPAASLRTPISGPGLILKTTATKTIQRTGQEGRDSQEGGRKGVKWEEMVEETDVVFEHNCGGPDWEHHWRSWSRGRLHQQQCFGGTRGTTWRTKVAEKWDRKRGEWKHENGKRQVPVRGSWCVCVVARRRAQNRTWPGRAPTTWSLMPLLHFQCDVLSSCKR